MIRRPTGLYEFLLHVAPRVDVAHGDLTGIVALLRDPAVEIRTIPLAPPPEDGVRRFSVVGWRGHFASELQRFAAYRQRADTTAVRQFFATADAALADYVEALPRLVAGLDLLLSRYPNAATVSQVITPAHRTALADAIAAELAA